MIINDRIWTDALEYWHDNLGTGLTLPFLFWLQSEMQPLAVTRRNYDAFLASLKGDRNGKVLWTNHCPDVGTWVSHIIRRPGPLVRETDCNLLELGRSWVLCFGYCVYNDNNWEWDTPTADDARQIFQEHLEFCWTKIREGQVSCCNDGDWIEVPKIMPNDFFTDNEAELYQYLSNKWRKGKSHGVKKEE